MFGSNLCFLQVRHGCDATCWGPGPSGCLQTLLHRAIDGNNESTACFLIRRSENPRCLLVSYSAVVLACLAGLVSPVKALDPPLRRRAWVPTSQSLEAEPASCSGGHRGSQSPVRPVHTMQPGGWGGGNQMAPMGHLPPPPPKVHESTAHLECSVPGRNF